MTKSKAQKLSKEFARVAVSMTQAEIEKAFYILIEEAIKNSFNLVARHMEINAANPKLGNIEIYNVLARLYRKQAQHPFGPSDIVINDETDIEM